MVAMVRAKTHSGGGAVAGASIASTSVASTAVTGPAVVVEGRRGSTVACGRLHAAREVIRVHSERGLATAEYAIATIAAAGFAGVLIVVLKSGKVQSLLAKIIESALNVG